jgi:hypothetical protein
MLGLLHAFEVANEALVALDRAEQDLGGPFGLVVAQCLGTCPGLEDVSGRWCRHRPCGAETGPQSKAGAWGVTRVVARVGARLEVVLN